MKTKELGGEKRLIDYDYDSSSGSTMVWTGKYEGPVTSDDILKFFGSGSFGHRGPNLFGDNKSGTFKVTQITD